MDDIPEVEWRSGELSIPTVRQELEEPLTEEIVIVVDLDKKKLDKVEGLIRYYEIMMEASTLFELAMWKAKIDQAEEASDDINRDAYRMEVPGPVKDAILQYLR